MKLSDPRFIKAMADGYEPPSDAEFRRRGLLPPVERRPYEDVPASICLPPFSVPIRGNPLSPPERGIADECVKRGWIPADWSFQWSGEQIEFQADDLQGPERKP